MYLSLIHILLRDKSVSEGDIKSWQSGLPNFALTSAFSVAKSGNPDCHDLISPSLTLLSLSLIHI